MKILQKRTFLFLVFLLPAFYQLQADTVVINFQKVFEEYSELKLQDQKLRQEVAEFQQTQQAKVQELQAKQNAFNELRNQAAQPEVTEPERKKMIETATTQLEELNREEQEIRQERSQFQKDLEAKGMRLRRGIVDKINAKVAKIAEAQGWDLVLDSSAKSPNGLSVVAYAAKAVDKTEMVIQETNAAATAEETTAEETTAEEVPAEEK